MMEKDKLEMKERMEKRSQRRVRDHQELLRQQRVRLLFGLQNYSLLYSLDFMFLYLRFLEVFCPNFTVIFVYFCAFFHFIFLSLFAGFITWVETLIV